MASDVGIANDALSMLGDKVITSFDDDTTRARLVKALYADTVDSCLRAHPWNCAVTRKSLAKLTADPVYGWDAQFTLPSDPYCLRVLALNDDEECGDAGDYFKVEGRKLLTNATTADIKFIKRVTDPNDYDALLKAAIVAKLAEGMAYSITGSLSVAVAMAQKYESVIREARTVDGQEGSPDVTSISILGDVR